MKTFWGLLAGTLIYSMSLCAVGNTCYRTGDDGEKHLNLRILYDEGIWGPLRSTKLLLEHREWRSAFKMFFHPSNPWLTIPASVALSHYLG